MALGNIKVSTPTYNEQVPSTKQQVLMRPFKVADEKVLMLAGETKDTKQMVNALKEVIGNCIDNIDVENLASFDLEYLFLKLRSVSVGETSDISVSCKSCKAKNPVVVNLGEIEVKFPEEHKNVYKVEENLAFEMKYPQMDIVAELKTDDFDSVLRMVAKSVKTVYHNEDSYEINSTDIDDVVGLLNQLNAKQFSDIQQFFENMPKVTEEVKFVCKECEEENTYVVEGLSNFF